MTDTTIKDFNVNIMRADLPSTDHEGSQRCGGILRRVSSYLSGIVIAVWRIQVGVDHVCAASTASAQIDFEAISFFRQFLIFSFHCHKFGVLTGVSSILHLANRPFSLLHDVCHIIYRDFISFEPP
jgi:hypothetical protein